MAKSNVLPSEVTPLGVAEIRLLLLPMATCDDLAHGDTAVATKGSDVHARACKLLQGRGLPGDHGYNKTSYFFNLNDGRKVSVARHVYKKDGPLVVIRVSKSRCELKAERKAELSRIEEYRLNAKRQEQEKAEAMANAKEHLGSPENFRTRMGWAISSLESYLVDGNRDCLFDRTGPATYRLDCDERAMQLLTQLKLIVTNCRIKPVRSLRLVAA